MHSLQHEHHLLHAMLLPLLHGDIQTKHGWLAGWLKQDWPGAHPDAHQQPGRLGHGCGWRPVLCAGWTQQADSNAVVYAACIRSL